MNANAKPESTEFNAEEIAAAAELRIRREAKTGWHIDWTAIDALLAELSDRGYPSDRVFS